MFRIRFRTVAMLAASLLAAFSVSCRKRSEKKHEPPPVVAPALRTNQLAGLPGPVYRAFSGSPVAWQQWTRETFDRAKAARRLVLAVVAMPQYEGFFPTLRQIEADPRLVATLNNDYVPVLVDGDAAREMSLLSAQLCLATKVRVQMPVFIWLTPEGDPITWSPVVATGPNPVGTVFMKAHATIADSWNNNRKFLVENGTLNSKLRREDLKKAIAKRKLSTDPTADCVRALRQLASLYDALNHTLDSTGNLFPTGTIDSLAAAALSVRLPAESRGRCVSSLNGLLDDLLDSAMFDPLDGGMFSVRQGSSWALPTFERDAGRQAMAVTALLRAHAATGNPAALTRALALIAFIEKAYPARDGLFALGCAAAPPIRNWLWTADEIRGELSKEDASLWFAASGIEELGNLPMESDPKRNFFRSNSLREAKTPAQLAPASGLPEDTVRLRLAAVRKRLLQARDNRMPQTSPDTEPHAPTCFRMVSAYAAAYAATGEQAYLDKARTLAERSRKTFWDGSDLWQFRTKTAPSVSVGRGNLYALAMQAALDLADVSGSPDWLQWADELGAATAQRFATETLLVECPPAAGVIDFPVSNTFMVFDDSTVGVVSAVESRFSAGGHPLKPALAELVTPFPETVLSNPVPETDLLTATLIRTHAPVLAIGSDIPPELATAAARLPLRQVNRRAATTADGVPPAAIKVIYPDDSTRIVQTPQELREAVLPSPQPR